MGGGGAGEGGERMQPISLTTEAIQSLLDENEALLQAILSNQNQGKLDACVAIQQKLQQNLSMLATVADQQPNRQMQQMAQNRGMGEQTQMSCTAVCC